MNQMHNFLKQQYEEMLKKDCEEKEKQESLTAGELIEVLKQVDPNSIVNISDWTSHYPIKDAKISNGTIFLYTFKI